MQDGWRVQSDLLTFQTTFHRLATVYPGVPLWTDRDTSGGQNTLGWWSELSQGGVGNCYLVASLNAVATTPDLIKDALIQAEPNRAGLYTVRLYVRGKPFLMNVDDVVQFEQSGQPAFGRMDGDHPSLWGPLLERAWSKLNGNYIQSGAGAPYQALRALLGCPTYSYGMAALLATQTAEGMWDFLQSGIEEYNYKVALGAWEAEPAEGSGGKLNSCGLHMSHAYGVLAVVPL